MATWHVKIGDICYMQVFGVPRDATEDDVRWTIEAAGYAPYVDGAPWVGCEVVKGKPQGSPRRFATWEALKRRARETRRVRLRLPCDVWAELRALAKRLDMPVNTAAELALRSGIWRVRDGAGTLIW
ncbi:hypothetical protein EDC27_0120 [Desulfosoma caldarium]|uniref:Uncharacterized protein n=1 Tax=Desulfosoma caldarium TaxID=610254 RepID=A0A3N1VKQ5_9BACT|nr:hypothetical protein EDC27_0120 [Desulfosoma caldarium]